MNHNLEELLEKIRKGALSEQDELQLKAASAADERFGLEVDVETYLITMINRKRRQADLERLREIDQKVLAELQQEIPKPSELGHKVSKIEMIRQLRPQQKAAGAKRKKDKKDSSKDD